MHRSNPDTLRALRPVATALIITATLAAGGCGEDPTAPTELAEYYWLETANGQELPLRDFMLLSGGGGCTLDLTNGHFEFRPGDRYYGDFNYWRDCPGTESDGSGSTTTTGTYQLVDGTVTLVPDSPSIVSVQEMTVSGARLFVSLLWSDDVELELVLEAGNP